jgi:outer membrane protein OmpA-like peptidoglycan-associated protein
MKKIAIQIPKPCHEDWNQMKVYSEGRFCDCCQKNVIDFSQKTDAEVLHILSRVQSSVCGRFRKDQLKTYDFPAAVPPPANWSKVALLLSGLSLAVPAFSQHIEAAKTASEQSYIQTKPSNEAEKQALNTQKDEKWILTGRVWSKIWGEYQIDRGVLIYVKGAENIRTETDSWGYYELDLTAFRKQKGKINLVVKSLGAFEKTIHVKPKVKKKNIRLKGKSRAMVMGFMAIPPTRTDTIGYTTGNIILPHIEFDGILLRPDSVFEFKGVEFTDSNYCELTDPSYDRLDYLAELLIKNPALRIEINSHTGTDLSMEYALQLTRNRANLIRDYLLAKGCYSGYILAVGLGKSQFQAGRKNDRIELKVLSLREE